MQSRDLPRWAVMALWNAGHQWRKFWFVVCLPPSSEEMEFELGFDPDEFPSDAELNRRWGTFIALETFSRRRFLASRGYSDAGLPALGAGFVPITDDMRP